MICSKNMNLRKLREEDLRENKILLLWFRCLRVQNEQIMILGLLMKSFIDYMLCRCLYIFGYLV